MNKNLDYLDYLDRKIIPKPIVHRCNYCGTVLVRLNETYLECPKCLKTFIFIVDK